MRYCFDIDGTICSTNCDYKEAKPYKQVIDKINSLYNSENKIILFTSRGTGSGIDWYDFTKKQLDSCGVKYCMLCFDKLAGDVHIDDKGIKDKDFFANETR